jgi:hypothetical protein
MKDLAYFVVKRREVAPLHLELLSLARANVGACFYCTCRRPYSAHVYDCDILSCTARGEGPKLYEAQARRMPIGRHFGR